MIGRVLPVPRRLDLIVLGCALSLSVLGILFVSSTTQGGRFEGLATRQAVAVASQPVPAVDGCQDKRDDGKEQRPEREQVEDGRVLRHHVAGMLSRTRPRGRAQGLGTITAVM